MLEKAAAKKTQIRHECGTLSLRLSLRAESMNSRETTFKPSADRNLMRGCRITSNRDMSAPGRPSTHAPQSASPKLTGPARARCAPHREHNIRFGCFALSRRPEKRAPSHTCMCNHHRTPEAERLTRKPSLVAGLINKLFDMAMADLSSLIDITSCGHHLACLYAPRSLAIIKQSADLLRTAENVSCAFVVGIRASEHVSCLY
jgi:hypothetical protein